MLGNHRELSVGALCQVRIRDHIHSHAALDREITSCSTPAPVIGKRSFRDPSGIGCPGLLSSVLARAVRPKGSYHGRRHRGVPGLHASNRSHCFVSQLHASAAAKFVLFHAQARSCDTAWSSVAKQAFPLVRRQLQGLPKSRRAIPPLDPYSMPRHW